MGVLFLKKNKGTEMKKTRILMVIGSTNMGGAQIFILNLLKNMDLECYQIDFAVNFEEVEGGIGQELRDMGCNIYTLPYFKVYNYFTFKKCWREFLTNHQYDIVHGHSSNSASVYLKVAKDMRCVTIAHSHSAGFRGNLIHRLLKRYFASKIRNVADYWFACSSIAAEHLYGKAYKEYKYYYDIPNAINTEKYFYNEKVAKDIRKEIGIKENDLLCGHVGSFTSPKNHIFLLSVFKEVLKKRNDAKLICCGDGVLLPQIKERAKELGIFDKIIFPGIVKNCNEYMMAMDVLIFPSLFEGFPMTIIEAEATGLPIVMSDVITPEVDITDCVHRLSLNEYPESWAANIIKLKSGDRSIYNCIVEDSKYNMKTGAKFIMSLYERMIQR